MAMGSLALVTPIALAMAAVGADPPVGQVVTVSGPIAPEAMGRTLSHEHVLVDFIGADQVSPDRYDADEVFEVMLPHLTRLREAGIETLVECTPNYLGRDPALLRRLSEASGVRLVTNTGLYKDPFLPQWAHQATAEEIAAEWVREAREGIGPEGIRPGFIKIAVNEGDLSEIQRKIVRAAALTSKTTGLVIASHTTQSVSALQELDILDEVGCPASHLIVVHCDAEPNVELHYRVAERGAFISYDGIREENADQRAGLIMGTLRRYPTQLLISQDAGWYNVGQPRGGQVVPWDWLPHEFVPILQRAGATEEDVRRLLVTNPARAFTIREPLLME